MSNQQVGSIYNKIIEEVVSSCQVTFEEEGVEQGTLDDMRTTWQQKLSSLGVADFPWDPKPVAPPPVANPVPVPSNASRPPASTALSGTTATSSTAIPTSTELPAPSNIKAEPVAPSDIYSLPPTNGISNHAGPEALQRASQALAERFPDKTQAQVAQLQARSAALANQPNGLAQQRPPQPGPQRMLPQHSVQGLSTEDQQRLLNEQRRMMYAQQRGQAQAVQGGGVVLTPQQQQQQQQQARYQYQQQMQAQQQRAAASMQQGQTDGASDWAAMVTARRAEAADGTGRERADHEIRQQVERIAREMEGGGLMLPISEVRANAKKASVANGKKRKASPPPAAFASPSFIPLPSAPYPSVSTPMLPHPHPSTTLPTTRTTVPLPILPVIARRIPQTDGPAGDAYIKDESVGTPNSAEQDDADAINSDLDDPDDEHGADEEEDGSAGQIMLCTYDKVQRVKNKWKCTLKDGVLTTGGREYVFHKGQGEFEW